MRASFISNDQISLALNISKEINKINEDSFVYSPISLILSLVLLLSGSRGETEGQIKNFISPTFSKNEIFNYYSAVYNKLSDDDLFVTLKAFNKGFLTEEYEIKNEYKDFIENYFNGSIEQISFCDVPHSIEKINNIVNKETNGSISKVIEANDINSNMKFILLSALYFKGDWHVKFEETDTQVAPFFTSPNSSKEIYLMSLEDKFNYFENDAFQMIQLPYIGKNMKMIIVLPKTKFIHDNFIKEHLSLNDIEYGFNNSRKIFIKVMIPKFDIATTVNFTPILKNLGIIDAFNDLTSNFNGISSNSSLYLDDVKQKAKIEVTETGTKAAAITSIKLTLFSGAEINNGEVKVFRADHAFSFYIIDKMFNIYFSGIFK
uniref:SERPIN domain-containing protein n=1 Tax=Strongyloides stercoralis TaxID=6248 RepID=A0A0K0EBJ8_STRER